MKMIEEMFAYFGLTLALPKGERLRNLRSNWHVVLSMLALGVLFMPGTNRRYAVAFPFSAIAIVFAASQWHGLFAMAWHSSKKVRALSAVSTFGYAVGIVPVLVNNFMKSSTFQTLFGTWAKLVLYAVATVGMLASATAVFVLFCLFWRLFLREAGGMIARALRSCSRAELLIYALLCAATLAYVAVVFARTGIFYEKGDSIYSADSSMLPNGNAFLHLAHGKNDLRQPLFAVFTAPFVAHACALSVFVPLPFAVALLMQWAQVVLLFLAVVLFARLCADGAFARVAVVACLCATYPYLLFALIVEQYILATFWLTLFLYAVCAERRRSRLLFYGAAGTLVTSVVFFPLALADSPRRPARWLKHTVFLACGYLALLLVFFRFQVIVQIVDDVRAFMRFSGKGIPFVDRLKQYVAFPASCFLAPASHITESLTWWLQPVTTWSRAGIVVLALCAVSAVVNRRQLLCRIAAAWVAFSFVLLCVIGWGTAENILVLYSLYFGWAFAVLLFALVKSAAQAVRIPALFPVVCLAAALFLLAKNTPDIARLIAFGAAHFPA
ncbi:MAG: hypothetical protein J1E32_07550 [Treponema sp.]|nr:hypothetical protein [Treponema sp.]